MGDFDPREHRRNTDPDTSDAAAHTLGKPHEALLRRLLGKFALEALTAEEAADRLQLDKESGYWKRVSDLKNRKLIVDTGLRRPGSSGRQQIVWRITYDGALEWARLSRESEEE